jgi:pilus assembly protein Flp/PilA
MEQLRAAVASATEKLARSRPMRSLRAVLAPKPGTTDDQQGQGLAEYALIMALIAIVVIASLTFLGSSIVQLFEDIINEGFTYVQELIGN